MRQRITVTVQHNGEDVLLTYARKTDFIVSLRELVQEIEVGCGNFTLPPGRGVTITMVSEKMI